ncbi:MAG: alpha/beta hydrolase [Candidatus Methylomirabilis oxyfera]|nr:alpha/beta hydrolase [Candidatus Methylomirabilis oxyfera]
MPIQSLRPLRRELLRIDGLTVACVKAGKRWPLRRERLVLVHGSGCSADSWRYQVDGLSREYEVVAPDLPGRGGSDPLDEPSIKGYAATVRGVVQRAGRRRVILAGHSLGGAVALQVALAYPELLKGLILVGASAYLEALALTPDILLWAVAVMPHKFKGMFFSDQVTQEALAIARGDVRRCSLETVLGDFAACRKYDFRGRLGGLNLPTLILCGSEDLITPVRHSKRLHKEIPGSTLVVIENAGHMVTLESPQQVNAAIRTFIREI